MSYACKSKEWKPYCVKRRVLFLNALLNMHGVKRKRTGKLLQAARAVTGAEPEGHLSGMLCSEGRMTVLQTPGE